MSSKSRAPATAITTEASPLETSSLREELAKFLKQRVVDASSPRVKSLGNYKYAVYAFYDYDGEPIYVGQTFELVSTRIRRHLTNQRTDAVAMNVLDPFEGAFHSSLAMHCIRSWKDQRQGNSLLHGCPWATIFKQLIRGQGSMLCLMRRSRLPTGRLRFLNP